ncbi:LTA synthase family protein [Virgibacillus sp. NKC19-16]|uniref:LTA synthase family protein n=1 Tax=Virgibacillus salidurans TaxID=2831673 RepID=UPI001F31E3E7|nr:LTA synthase family protein [Virgibacillus sp. NKC19-16]UJL45892.1 LTA synthase family protein [Virgibacillus sp. NKC19-16]
MKFKQPKIPLFIIATLLMGLKTYIVYRFMFNLGIENQLQEIILFINPFVSVFLIFALSVWFNKQSRQMKFIRYTALIGTLIIYANLVFYRSFNDFITLPQLFQASNMSDLGSSILTLIQPYDLLLIADVVIIWLLSKRKQDKVSVSFQKSGKAFALAISLLLLAGNFFLAETERPQLLTRGFDREVLVKNMGIFNYHIYDVVQQAKTESQRVFADGNGLNEIKDYVNEHVKTDEVSDLEGVAEDKNIILINAESVQSFLINNEMDGQEVTPFMNSLTEDEDTYYFENFYHQTAQGKSSDAEFLVDNSLYPLPSGAVFFTHAGNEYNALPETLNENGYTSATMHANNKSYWNRNSMYGSLGYDKFFGEESYNVTQENAVGWGLKDKPFFEQSMDHLQSLEQPFYSKMITLTNHHPFEIGEEDASIGKYDSNSATLNNYFQTSRYTDEAIEEFFGHLKESGLYEDSIIVIMGDHDGISQNHNQAMAQYLDKEEITPYDTAQLQRVPLFIHIPGHGEGEVKSEVSGQIDLKPTLLSMAGIENENDIHFGNDLFVDDRKGYIAFRNGDFVSEEYVYAGGTCYNRQTGEPIEQNNTDDGTESESQSTNESESEATKGCAPINDKVSKELGYSDDIIYGDLFRFVEDPQGENK